MKTVATAAAFACLCATALASEPAVPQPTLANMGLASMQPLSDADGMAVRGKGFFDTLTASLFPEWVFTDLFAQQSPFDSPVDSPFDTPLDSPFESPSGSAPESPFTDSPFGNSMLGNFQGGSQNFGSGPSVGGNSFGFQGHFPAPSPF